ncbi:hypothetical protein [Flavobacterium sp.]|uniref:hypothetical protein n=1 Tax=Flavobacterium sp. TaxID=239 RepID=UPI003A8EF021
MKNYALLFISLIFTVSIYAQDKVQIISENNSTTTNALNLDPFYFTHQLFSEAIYMTQLNNVMNQEEMYSMVKGIYDKIDIEKPVSVTVNNENGNPAKFFFRIIIGKNDIPIFLMQTNYNADDNIFESKISENTWMRFYIIDNGRLIHNSDLYSIEGEKEAFETSKYSPIGYYMFDEKKDNDSKIKPLIDQIINDTESNELEVLYAKLYFTEYYLMYSDFKAAKKQLEEVKSYFEKHKGNKIPENYALLPNMLSDEYYITTKLVAK